MASKIAWQKIPQPDGSVLRIYSDGTTLTYKGGKAIARGTASKDQLKTAQDYYKNSGAVSANPPSIDDATVSGLNVTPTQAPATPQTPTGNTNVQVVPDNPKPTDTQAINVADFAGQTVTDPSLIINKEAGTSLADAAPKITDAQVQGGLQSSAPATGGDPKGANVTNVATAGTQQAQATNATTQQAQVSTGAQQAPKNAASVQTALTADDVNQLTMEGQHGTVSDQSQVNADELQIDTDATAKGENELGKALSESAQQDLNLVDPKATVKGQMDILAEEFVDPLTGQPKIPSWAAGVARNVSRIAAFKGMTGTAATAAMAQALLEASMPMAQADAQFYQTLTVQNLNNKQQATLNRANVLAQLDMANLDARTTAAVTNSQAFLQMDLANLSNDQQAELINTQQRFQSILEDAKAENTKRLFLADSENEMTKFYDQLSSQMEQFNAAQKNSMAQFNASEFNETSRLNASQATAVSQFNASEANKTSQFNASETNAVAKFNAELETMREQFYREMQFQVDTANAKWRQTVTLTNNQNAFDAAATDVKNRVGISVEQLNQLWDRADALLDYAWKSGQNDKDRKTQLALVTLKGQLDADAADAEGVGNVIGTILGAVLGWVF